MAFKARKDHPNEDALLVKQREELYLLAVADAHYGVESSHRLLQRLARAQVPQTRFELLKLCLDIQRPHETAHSGTTLLAALYHRVTGHVYALSTGDSTLATLDEQGWRVHNQHNEKYLRLDKLSYPDSWNEVELDLKPDSLLVLHTDGVDECHYRRPETSLRPHHIEALRQQTAGSTAEDEAYRFAAALAEAALRGVDGHPGGQDNIAVLVVSHSKIGSNVLFGGSRSHLPLPSVKPITKNRIEMRITPTISGRISDTLSPGPKVYPNPFSS